MQKYTLLYGNETLLLRILLLWFTHCVCLNEENGERVLKMREFKMEFQFPAGSRLLRFLISHYRVKSIHKRWKDG